ncbi:MAG: hypothetical protein UT38_C0007G0032 [Microgenomates group bacterium GW2011_GWA2_39_19]|nr:MAG: hypothetical protein UT38_C0007G0032 [Microgenomates group bacterium GW2011_GWA2_39_19]
MNNLNYRKLLDISQNTGLPVKKILDLLFIIKQGKKDALEEKTGISKNVLSLVLPCLANIQVEFDANYKTEEELFCVPGDVVKITSALQKYNRPEPKREYDQFMATLETTAKRVALMNFFEDIRDKRLLFLGDDDLMLAAVNVVGEPILVQALDIDKRQLETIKAVGKDFGKTIFADLYDARNDLPARYKGRFDVVFTDPPYTTEGVRLFLSRAIDALDKQNEAARIYFCFGNSDRAKERFLPIYQAIVDSGLMLRWVFDKFNRYEGAESIGSTSTLFVCDITPKTKPLVKGGTRDDIYTNN